MAAERARIPEAERVQVPIEFAQMTKDAALGDFSRAERRCLAALK